MARFDRLVISDVGQIRKADIEFSDLTIFVGPQATGKSITLQFLKLMTDTKHVQDELTRYGLDWSGKLSEFLDIYFGEGMNSIWQKNKSFIEWNGQKIVLEDTAKKKKGPRTGETLFYIPAQRVLTLADGWPKPFTSYRSGDPFAVREFSEKLRVLMENEFNETPGLFPQERRLKQEYKDLLTKNIFSKFNLNVDKHYSQKRFVLSGGDTEKTSLPYMVWSAGQREFVPLLLGLYWLMPRGKAPKREDIERVVLEEPEMGLHPKAISVVLLLVMELLSRDYRISLSTHSPQVLEVVWAINQIQARSGDSTELLKIFDVANTQQMRTLAEKILTKTFKVYYFDPETKSTKDISGLDPNSVISAEAGWGGLSEYSGRANEVVSQLPLIKNL